MANHVLYDAMWESDRLAECSRDAALAYPWIFLVADDWGRFEYRPRAIWKHAFAYRHDVTVEDVAKWLDEYWRVGLLIRYHIDGDLAYWYKFIGRREKDRKASKFPDPSGMPEVKWPSEEISPGKSGNSRETPGDSGKTRFRSRSDLDQSRDRSDLPATVVAAPSTEGWNSEAAELWHHEYKGNPPKAFFAALKPLVKREGWPRVRPALVTYMAETPADYVNIAGKFVAAFGTWVERANGVPSARASPQRFPTQGEVSVAAVQRFVQRGIDADRSVEVLAGALEAGSGLSDADG